MAQKVLVVIDMQNDFIDGALANKAAQAIVPKIADYISQFEGLVVFTQDTHYSNYLYTREGKHLPIPHCIYGTQGWEVNSKILEAAKDNPNVRYVYVDKDTFSAGEKLFASININLVYDDVESIELCGTCTDICVISNALALIRDFRDGEIIVHESMCAGLTEEKHKAALEVMRSCQIEVVE